VTDHLTAVMAMLGPARTRPADPSAWERLHAELGFELPADYRAVVDAYAPVQLNGHLYLSHPATGWWNLGEWIGETVAAWQGVGWDSFDLPLDEDPRRLFGLEVLRFGTPDGLWPLASSDRGETVFLVADTDAPRYLVAYCETLVEHRIGFAEWLHRYLLGEDMTGPNSAVFYPGPVRLDPPPMPGADRTKPWYGPDRGM
jgi:hypothetical protein